MPPRSRGLYLPLIKAIRASTLSPAPFPPPSSATAANTTSAPTAPSQPPPRTSKSPPPRKSRPANPRCLFPEIDTHIPNNKATLNRDAELDPNDHSALQTDIDKALARLKDALTKTRDAGRVSGSMIEDLPVELNVKGSQASGAAARKETSKIGDLASVVPKGGRSMHVFCAEEAHLKPIVAAIQASPYSLTPQAAGPSDNNPLLITVPVPPVTAETRAQAAAEAKKCMERASLDVRTARGEAQKVFRKMELQKLVVQDELRKAHKGMEEVAKKGQDEVKRVGEAAIKALER